MARLRCLCDDSDVDTIELSVGDRARHEAGVAIVSSLSIATAYAAFTVLTKETPALYLHQPWQDDPYDALVSFDFVALPLLVIIGALRVRLCRRYETLSMRRVVDLLRVCGVATGLGLATQVAEWVAVARGAHSARWNALSAWQVVVLVALTAATIGAGVLLRRARLKLARIARPAAQPDWLADAVALGLRAARLLGPLAGSAQSAVRWTDEQIITRVRAHPIVAAVLFAVVLTLPGVAAKIVLEGYPAALVLVVFGVSAASLFAFVVLGGWYLRVVAPRRARPSVWLCSAVVACVAGPLAWAFRDALLRTVGAEHSHQTMATLAALMLGAAVLAGTLSLTTQAAFRSITRRQRFTR